jgi:hypothetical protein
MYFIIYFINVKQYYETVEVPCMAGMMAFKVSPFAYHVIPVWPLAAFVNQARAFAANKGYYYQISVNRMARELYRNEGECFGGEV